MRGISSAIPKKVTRVKTDLIDLDLIRGSAFSKAKPKQGRVATTCLGILRFIFYPFYLIWWTDQTNRPISCFLLLLYLMQLSSMYIYFHPDHISDLTCSIDEGSAFTDDDDDDRDLDQIPPSEVIFPVIMFLILSVMQSHIAASHSLQQQQQSHVTSDRTRSRSGSRKATEIIGSNGNSRKTNAKRKKRSPDKQKPQRNGVTQSSNPETTDKENEARKRFPFPDDEDEDVAARNNRNNHNNSQKPSDEESGLEIAEFSDPKSLKGGRRNVMAQLSVNRDETVANRSPGTSGRDSRSCDRTTGKSEEQVTGWEGDQSQEDGAELSSLDEISPYSTVNSESWRRYSDILSQRIRSLSQSRRLSAAETDTACGRPRSNTHVVKHAARCRRSPGHSHPDVSISSNDSEASVSPTPLNQKDAGELDWPMLNSEGTSEEEMQPEQQPAESLSAAFCDMGPRCCDMGRSERVSCAIWQQLECQKVDLSSVDISSAVIRKAERARHSNEYLFLALGIALVLSAIPALFRLQVHKSDSRTGGDDLLLVQPADGGHVVNDTTHDTQSPVLELMHSLLSQVPVPDPGLVWESLVASNCSLLARYVVIVAAVERFFTSIFFFFLLCVAEHTYREVSNFS